MYNQFQGSFGQPVQSQYRGNQKQFQPTGAVQSFYNQQAGNFAGSQQAQNYHLQNYAGNQQGHDAYLRADSVNPSSYAANRAQGISSMNSAPSAYNANVPASQYESQGFQQTGTNSYHLANYAGNQQGHDAYLRADSMQPSSFSMGRNQAFSSMNMNVPTSQLAGQSNWQQQQFRNF